MENKTIYTLPMFSSLLSELPQITFSGTTICINLKGYDYDDIYSEVELIFQEVHYFSKTNALFSANTIEAYDKVLEIFNSSIILQLMEANRNLFEEMNKHQELKHYSLHLDGYDGYNIVCKSIEIKEL